MARLPQVTDVTDGKWVWRGEEGAERTPARGSTRAQCLGILGHELI